MKIDIEIEGVGLLIAKAIGFILAAAATWYFLGTTIEVAEKDSVKAFLTYAKVVKGPSNIFMWVSAIAFVTSIFVEGGKHCSKWLNCTMLCAFIYLFSLFLIKLIEKVWGYPAVAGN